MRHRASRAAKWSCGGAGGTPGTRWQTQLNSVRILRARRRRGARRRRLRRPRASHRSRRQRGLRQHPTRRTAARPIALPLRIKTRLAVGKVRRGHRKHRSPPQPREASQHSPSAEASSARPAHHARSQPDLRCRHRSLGADSRFPRRSGGGSPVSAPRAPVASPSRPCEDRAGGCDSAIPGTPTIRARTSLVDLRVRASSSFRANRRRVVNGEDVTFHGRVHGRRTLPAGKLVELAGLHAAPLADVRATEGESAVRHVDLSLSLRGDSRHRDASASARACVRKPGSRTSWARPGVFG